MFIETPNFPDTIAMGSRFGPVYSTAKARNLGGFEVSNQNWAMPLYEGDVMQGARNQAQLDDLLAFFHGVAGMHNGFRFKNFNDYTATGAQGTVVQLSATTWQMYKTYTYGALSFARKISKPIAGSVIAGGGSYTVDTTTGIITVIGSPSFDPTSWTGEFDFPVRFDIDKMLPQWIAYKYYDWTAIQIMELRL